MKFYLLTTVALVVALQVSADSDPSNGNPTLAKCPNVGLPVVEPGCKLETVKEYGCTFYKLNCDKKRKPRSAKPSNNKKCKGEPTVESHCVKSSGPKDADGCPTWDVNCITSDPPREEAFIAIADHPKRLARATKCPKLPKADKGCKLTLGAKDASGCPSWTMECNGRK